MESIEGSEAHQFFLFGPDQIINDTNVFVGYLLNICLGSFFFILGNGCFVCVFFQLIITFPADIAHGNFRVFTNFLNLFDVFLTTFFGKRRHDQADEIAVV